MRLRGVAMSMQPLTIQESHWRIVAARRPRRKQKSLPLYRIRRYHCRSWVSGTSLIALYPYYLFLLFQTFVRAISFITFWVASKREILSGGAVIARPTTKKSAPAFTA